MLRMLTLADLPQCMALSTEAHWNQAEADWKFLIEQAHPLGLVFADKGLIATTVAWDLPAGKTWINMVLVTEGCRGRGYARRLMQAALAEAAGRGMAAGLDATVFGAPVYERLGFGGDQRIVRLKARLSGDKTKTVRDVMPLMLAEIPEVVALDAAVLGAERTAMLHHWRERLPSAAWGQRSKEGKLTGFLLGREGRVATQLGPMVADDAASAAALLGAALDHLTGPVVIDVPRVHAGWIESLQELGFEQEREFRRMAKPGGELATDWSRYFAAAGPDFA